MTPDYMARVVTAILTRPLCVFRIGDANDGIPTPTGLITVCQRTSWDEARVEPDPVPVWPRKPATPHPDPRGVYTQVGVNPSPGGWRATMVGAHRLVCWAYHGPPPPPVEGDAIVPIDDWVVMHSCGHKDCVAHAHLAWGRQAQNIADARAEKIDKKGRQGKRGPKGPATPAAAGPRKKQRLMGGS